VIGVFAKSFGQLGDPRSQRLIWLSLVVALAVFAALWASVAYLLANTAVFTTGWLETALDLFGGLAAVLLAWLLFPAVVGIVIGLLLEQVCVAVERRHYPALAPAPGLGVLASLLSALKFLIILLLLNIVLLVFLVIPPLFPFVFYGVNGYLLGREYFELVALRRLKPAAAKSLRKKHRWSLFLAGATITFLLTVPVANLVAPVVATAAMVHLFEEWRQPEA